MAEPNITFTVFGTAKKAEEAIVRLEKKYDDLQNKIKQTAKRSREGNDVSLLGLGKISGQLLSAVAGYTSLSSAASGYYQMQQRILQITDDLILAEDKRARVFATQAGLRELESPASAAKIRSLSTRNAVPFDIGFAAATQLVSSGFSVPEATGESLNVALQARAASNALGRDPTESIQAASMALAANNLDKTASNFRMVMVDIVQKFLTTDEQTADLKAFAQRNSAYSSRVDFATASAAYNLIRQRQPADVASTGLSASVLALMTARSEPTKVAALRRLALRPESVDLVGETLEEALDRLWTGLQRVPEKLRDPILRTLVGIEGLAAMNILLTDRAKLPGIRAAATGPGARKAFEESAAYAQSGPNAAAQVLANEDEQRRLERADPEEHFANLLQAAINRANKEGGVNSIRDATSSAHARFLSVFMKPSAAVDKAFEWYLPPGGSKALVRDASDADSRWKKTDSDDLKAIRKAMESIDSKATPSARDPLKDASSSLRSTRNPLRMDVSVERETFDVPAPSVFPRSDEGVPYASFSRRWREDDEPPRWLTPASDVTSPSLWLPPPEEDSERTTARLPISSSGTPAEGRREDMLRADLARSATLLEAIERNTRPSPAPLKRNPE
jgi:hypothetical protein